MNWKSLQSITICGGWWQSTSKLFVYEIKVNERSKLCDPELKAWCNLLSFRNARSLFLIQLFEMQEKKNNLQFESCVWRQQNKPNGIAEWSRLMHFAEKQSTNEYEKNKQNTVIVLKIICCQLEHNINYSGCTCTTHTHTHGDTKQCSSSLCSYWKNMN